MIDGPTRSDEDIGVFLRRLKGAFADARRGISLIGPFRGDEVVACWTPHEWHAGGSLGAPPCGAEVAFDGVDLRTMRGGELFEQRRAVDVASPMGQIVG